MKKIFFIGATSLAVILSACSWGTLKIDHNLFTYQEQSKQIPLSVSIFIPEADRNKQIRIEEEWVEGEIGSALSIETEKAFKTIFQTAEMTDNIKKTGSNEVVVSVSYSDFEYKVKNVGFQGVRKAAVKVTATFMLPNGKKVLSLNGNGAVKCVARECEVDQATYKPVGAGEIAYHALFTFSNVTDMTSKVVSVAVGGAIHLAVLDLKNNIYQRSDELLNLYNKSVE